MSNNIAIVTGGSRGLGRNAVLHLARQGIDVIFTYHSNQMEAAEVQKQVEAMGRNAVALQLDVGNSNSFPAFAQEVKSALQQQWQREQFDFLINNAGIGIHTPYAETTEAQFDALMNIHLKGVFFLTINLLELIKNGGRIINISTGLTRFTYPGYAAYAAMKGGVEVLTRYMAKELGPRGISVNVVAPGAIETDFSGGAVRDNKALNDFLAAQTALGRVGLPDDIGGVIAAMVAENSRWINGQRIEASGGMFL
jgi:NAD(P)-dependent dehydrogenase (short-subunit alcohol dehydrogenase family)